MANIIDEFVVSLGLDPRQYNDEIKKYREGVKRDRQEAESASKDDAIYRRRAAEGIRQVRNEVVSLGLAFAAAGSVKGFITGILTGDASTAHLADNIGVSAMRIKSLEEAIKTVGGTAAEAQGTVSGLFDTFQSYQLGDNSKGGWLASLGMTANDLKDPIAALEKMAAARERLHMSNGEFRAKARGIGVDDETITAMEAGSRAFKELLDQKEKDAKFSYADAKAAEEFQHKLGDLETAITGGARPALYSMVNQAIDFVKQVGVANVAMPILIALTVAAGAAAMAAVGPWGLLAAAIAGAATASAQYATMAANTNDPKKLKSILGANGYQQQNMARYMQAIVDHPSEALYWAHQAYLYGKYARAVNSGDKVTIDNMHGQPAPPPGGWSSDPAAGATPAGDTGAVSGLFSTLEKKYGTDRARGIWAGMGAESGWNPNALSADGGAYGLGQWRGPRLAMLRKQYGKKDGTVSAEDQIKFLMWELEGGDKGGASVLNSTSALEALSNYIGGTGWGFMRPGAGRSGDMNRGQSILGIRAGGRRHSSHRTTHIHVGGVTVHTSDARNIPRDVGRKIGDNVAIINANSGLE